MPRRAPIKPFEEARPDVWHVRDAAAKGGLVFVQRMEQWICSVCGETLCDHVRGPRADVIARLSRRTAVAQAAAQAGSKPQAEAGSKPQAEASIEPQAEAANGVAPAASVASETTALDVDQDYVFQTIGMRRTPRPVKVSDRSVRRLGSEAA